MARVERVDLTYIRHNKRKYKIYKKIQDLDKLNSNIVIA